MATRTIFISFSFTDNNATAICRVVREVATRLRRVTIVDGNTLYLSTDFSGQISSFIRESADYLVAIFTQDESAKPNVLFEIGIAIGANKDVILVSETPDDVPTMLRAHDITTINRHQLDWHSAFCSRLERKFRTALQIPEDHLVEDKLARRYQREELSLMDNPEKLQAAIVSIRAGDLRKAETILRKMLDGDQNNLDAFFLLADCLYLQGCSAGDPAVRMQLFSRQHHICVHALELETSHILLLNMRAQADIRLGEFDAGHRTLKEILARKSDFSVAHYNLACLHALLDERKESLMSLRTAIALNSVWRDFAKGDPDFTSLWKDQDWLECVYGAG